MDTNNNQGKNGQFLSRLIKKCLGDENRRSIGSKKRSCEAEDCEGSREKTIKRRSTQMKTLGSIDDLSIGLKSPESKVTIDDYRATQRLKAGV